MEADHSEILQAFNRIVAGAEFDDLRGFGGTQLGPPGASQNRSATMRRAPLAGPAIFRVRVDLDGASPPIWRRLEIRSDLHLDRVHEVIQAAFGWHDAHLYLFTLGGAADDEGAERFLCPFDIDDGEPGTPAASVRLDETLQRAGERLHYLYDYGDDWRLTIRLEEVHAPTETSPRAICTGGRRAAPPEDSGGHRDAQRLAEIIPDPTFFDRTEINTALAANDPILHANLVLESLPRTLFNSLPAQLLETLTIALTLQGADVADRLGQLAYLTHRPIVDDEAIDIEQATLALARFLRLIGEGVTLTYDGFLPAPTVRAVASFLPAMSDWIEEVGHEARAQPVWSFRLAAEALGLIRKYRGALVLTAAGRTGVNDPRALWNHLAGRIANPPRRGEAVVQQFRRDAILLALFYIGSGRDIQLNDVVRVLEETGWRGPRRNLMRALVGALANLRALFDSIGPAVITADGLVTFGPGAEALAIAALAAEGAAEQG